MSVRFVLRAGERGYSYLPAVGLNQHGGEQQRTHAASSCQGLFPVLDLELRLQFLLPVIDLELQVRC